MSVRLTILVAICFGSVAQAQDVPKWLAGCWELRGQGRLTVEMWMPPAGNLMLGGSRTVVNRVVREFEHLRIKSDAGKLTYIALPSGQNETPFPAKEVSGSSLVFENLSHDFPQRIIYRKRGADSIVARIEGRGPNSRTRGFDFPMRRASCTDP
ncbi:MAG TPA: DUF6265 family protein [Gemmatimonadaceae bacterium]|nr:DUF6265 family protein [Gemmatimonadaceae bacterium]